MAGDDPKAESTKPILGFTGYQLPPPTDWQAFERLCRDLWAAIWNDQQAKLHGRSGQSQGGVDVYGRSGGAGPYRGVQCKRRGNQCDPGEITEKELRDEVAKARTFDPPLSLFTLAFTGQRDEGIQAVARRITLEHEALGLFEVEVCSWDDIADLLGTRAEVVRTHYAAMVAAVLSVSGYDRLEVRVEAASGVVPTTSPGVPTGSTSIALSDGTRLFPLDGEHQAEIQMVRGMLKSGHAQDALEQAQTLSTRIWSGASPITRARLCVLKGHVLLDLGQTDAAGAALRDAAGHAPNDAAIQAQVAFGHSIAGDIAAARNWSRKSLDLDPTNITAIQISALHDERPDEVVLAEHEQNVGARAELFAALGQRSAARDDLDAAERWLEQSISKDATNLGAKAIAADVIINSIGRALTAGMRPGAAQRDKILRALQLFDDAIDGLRTDGARKAHDDWYAARIAAKRLLASPDVAASADSAIATCGPTPKLVLLAAMVASESGDHAKTIALIESLARPLDDNAAGLLAAAYGNAGDNDRSLELWKELLQRSDLEDGQRHDTHLNQALTLHAMGRASEAGSLIEDRIVAEPGSLSPVLVAIQVAERIGDTKMHDGFLDKGVALAATGSAYLQLKLADTLYRAERWSEAAQVYALAAKPGSVDIFGRLLIQSLYKAGQYATALAACDEAEVADGPSRFITEMRSLMSEELGDLKQAEHLCRAYLEIEPANVPVAMRLAHVLQRGGDVSASVAALAGIALASIDSLEVAVPLARLLVRAGRESEALELLYRLRRSRIADLDAHLAFVGIYNLVGRDMASATDVTPDCSVELTGHGAPGWILLSPSTDADIVHKEYPPQHSLAVRLLGKRVGESVQVGATASSWTISRVGTKYGFAFGRTLELFPSLFPDSDALQLRQVSKDPGTFLTEMKGLLRQGAPREAAVIAEYVAGRCTVGTIAVVLNRPIRHAIDIASGSQSGLQCAANTVEEREVARRILAGQPNLLLDDTAIVTLDSLGLLREGGIAGRKLSIAQSTLDNFAAELARWDTADDNGAMSIGLEGDEVVRYQTDADGIRLAREYFRALVGWLRANTVVMAVSPETAENNAQHNRLAGLIGQSSWDAIRIATEDSVVLVSDDLRLRQLAKSVLGIDSVCSPHLLMFELEKGRLQPDRYTDAIVRLIGSNYGRLPVGPPVLEAAARAEQWRPGPTFLKVLGALRGPETVMEGAVDVAAQFIHVVFLNVALAEQRSVLLMAVLDVIVAGRRHEQVIAHLILCLQRYQALLPIHHAEALRIIKAWAMLRIIPLT